MVNFRAQHQGAFRRTGGAARAAAFLVGAAVLLTACSGTVSTTGRSTSSSSGAPTASCPSPEPTVTVTATAGVEPSSAATESESTAPCPTATETVTVALHRSGEACTRSGDTYLAVEPALLCFRDKAGKALWMTAAQVRQTQVEIAKAKAAADVARKKAQAKAQEAARQKAAAAELEKAAAAAAAQKAAAEAQKAQAPAEQTPRRFVPEAPQNPPAPEAPAVPAAPDPGSVYYPNCAAARAAGAAPIYAGQPGYRPKLDRDGDGVACE